MTDQMKKHIEVLRNWDTKIFLVGQRDHTRRFAISLLERVDKKKMAETIFQWACKQLDSDVYVDNKAEELATAIYNYLVGEEGK